MGLAYDSISVNRITPAFYEMVNQGLIDKAVFSFRIGPSEDDAGTAVFGGIDSSHYTGKIKYAPVRRKAYWEVEMTSVTFGDETLELENTGAAIDTGTSLIAMPSDVATMLNSMSVYFFSSFYLSVELTSILGSAPRRAGPANIPLVSTLPTPFQISSRPSDILHYYSIIRLW